MTSDLESDVQQLWALLFAIVLDGEKRLQAYLDANGLTPPQFYVLKTLAEEGGRCPIGQIARRHHLPHPTMTGLVQRLETLGIVRRETRHSDRRSVDVVLTEEGIARFQAIQDSLQHQLSQVLALLAPHERADLLRYLNTYLMGVKSEFPLPTL